MAHIEEFLNQEAVGYDDRYAYLEGAAWFSDGTIQTVYTRTWGEVEDRMFIAHTDEWRTTPYPGHPGTHPTTGQDE